MTHYMIQWSYDNDQIQALVDRPHDRSAEFSKLVEAFEGTLKGYYFAFGEYDGVAIAEFPGDRECAACMLSAAGTGAAKVKTTILLDPEESEAAMKLANSVSHDYRTPVGYSSHG